MVEVMLADADQSGLLSDMRLATACLLGYATFLRFSELVDLRPCDFSIVADVMTIHIPRSKNDQLRQGDEVVLVRTRSKTCPVSRLESYLHRVEMTLRDERFLFRTILKMKNGKRLQDLGKISYSCLCSLFLKKIAALGFPAQEFDLHNIRSGGATAATNAQVPDRIFKRHG